ncbi:acetyltransferase [Echinicola sp. CAU 1574]|uniref:Acetyltransferase n=1 Tax=Echinicola arenosa TaxID=2774144 RepID=A0ABR9AFX2_9BACT|nr:acetyltransferase [Echinicola arenosa]MBD8487646.1 acetyltransferase [Echinicola arenosa]
MYIYGASGHAKVVISGVESQGIGIFKVFDDNPECTSCLGYPVSFWDAGEYEEGGLMVVAIGDNVIRKIVVERLGSEVQFGRVFHRQSVISKYVEIGKGTVVMAGAIIQANVKIGDHVIVNTGAAVDHDCEIEDFVHIAPSVTLCGNVHVGKGSLIGAGSVVIPGISIGENCVIGAGSTVLRNVSDGETVYGVVK